MTTTDTLLGIQAVIAAFFLYSLAKHRLLSTNAAVITYLYIDTVGVIIISFVSFLGYAEWEGLLLAIRFLGCLLVLIGILFLSRIRLSRLLAASVISSAGIFLVRADLTPAQAFLMGSLIALHLAFLGEHWDHCHMKTSLFPNFFYLTRILYALVGVYSFNLIFVTVAGGRLDAGIISIIDAGASLTVWILLSIYVHWSPPQGDPVLESRLAVSGIEAPRSGILHQRQIWANHSVLMQ